MIILPRSGLRAATTGLESSTVNALFALKNGMGQDVRLANIASNIGLAAASPSLAGNTTLKVIDSIAENGAKLIETPDRDAPLPPVARMYLEQARDFCGANAAALPTPEAIRMFNQSRARRIGLFHVTC
jgi:hypothetical protein